jgi:hypothetical protein
VSDIYIAIVLLQKNIFADLVSIEMLASHLDSVQLLQYHLPINEDVVETELQNELF